jgi:6-phosphogluconolactonase (cycloisomerase 2 family)
MGLTAGVVLAAAPLSAFAAQPRDGATRPTHPAADQTALYLATENPAGNQILTYARASDGTLSHVGTYDTDGLGGVAAGATADPASSQNSLVTVDGGRLLLAVNPGSDTVSVFATDGTHLRLEEVVPSHGEFPASIAVRGDLVYVLNSGGTGTVSGYRILPEGLLWWLPGSTRSLGLANTNPPNFLHSPGQVGFNADGDQLIVTTKASGSDIDVFAVHHNGWLSAAPRVNASTTPVPYAFVIGPKGELVVGEAGTSSVSTYTIGKTGKLTGIGSVSDGQSALCWITRIGGHYYVDNSASSNVSEYTLTSAGAPHLVGIAATTGAGDTDSVATSSGRFLYVENGGAGAVDEFAVSSSGALTSVGTLSGLATGMEGIALG